MLPRWDRAFLGMTYLTALALRRPLDFFDWLITILEMLMDRSNQAPSTYRCSPELEDVLERLEAQLGVPAKNLLGEPPLLNIEAQVLRKIENLRGDGPFPLSHSADIALARLIYIVCRLMKPNIVLETGVAYGVTSAFVFKTGGLFHLFLPFEPQPWTLYALLYRMNWRAKEIHCLHIHFFHDAEARELIQQCGFSVQRIRWSFHSIFSFVDVAYFTSLVLRGRHVSTSVEGYLHNGRRGLRRWAPGVIKDARVALGYYESRLLRWMSGGRAHFTALKQPATASTR